MFKQLWERLRLLAAGSASAVLLDNLLLSCRQSATASLFRQAWTEKSLGYAWLERLFAALAGFFPCPRARRPLGWFRLGSIILAAALLPVLFLPGKQALQAAGGVLFAAAIFFRAIAGVYATALLFPFVGPKVLFAISVLTFLSFLLRVNRRTGFYHTPALIPLGLFLVVQFGATLTSISPLSSATEFYIPLGTFLYLFAMINLFRRREEVDRLLLCLAFASFIVAATAVFQFYTGTEAADLGRTWIDPQTNPDIKKRACAFWETPNALAHYLMFMAPLTLAGFLNFARAPQKAFFFLCTVLNVFALVLTYSRGGWLGFAAVVLVFLVLQNWRFVLALPPVGVIFYFFLPHTILQRLSTITNLEDTSNLYRLLVWRGTFDLIKDYWLTGVGYGWKSFTRLYYTYMINGTTVPHAHNLYLQIISELGVLGLAVFLWLFGHLFRIGLKIQSSRSPSIRNLNAGVLATLAGFLVHSLFDYTLCAYATALLPWTMMGVLLVLEKFDREGVLENGEKI